MFHNDFSDDLNIMRNLDDFLSDTLDFNRLTKSYDGLRTLNFNNFLTTNRFLDDGLFFDDIRDNLLNDSLSFSDQLFVYRFLDDLMSYDFFLDNERHLLLYNYWNLHLDGLDSSFMDLDFLILDSVSISLNWHFSDDFNWNPLLYVDLNRFLFTNFSLNDPWDFYLFVLFFFDNYYLFNGNFDRDLHLMVNDLRNLYFHNL